MRPASRSAIARLLLALPLGLALSASAWAQSWPSKPLRVIVPGAPGTSPDLLARTIAQYLTPRLGQQIVVANQPGAGGNLGHGTAAKAVPDGYTLLVTSDQLSINESLFKDLPFHAVNSFIPVVQAITLLTALVIALTALTVDLLYYAVDPRVRKRGLQ